MHGECSLGSSPSPPPWSCTAWDGDSVTIAGETVPLLERADRGGGAQLHRRAGHGAGDVRFPRRLTGLAGERPPLVSATPYRPGLIPVVFVHGTGSSTGPVGGDVQPTARPTRRYASRFQFWFFQYDSGNPIALSALRLREALSTAVARLDPDGKDPALRQMVLIGHSQGGLLVKMQVISTGDRLWNAVSRKPLDELELSDQTRDLFRRGLFVEPVPEVARVIFVCTPHRGSFVAGRRILANLTRQLLTLPFTLTGLEGE